MKRIWLSTALFAAVIAANSSAVADDKNDDNRGNGGKLTIAVFGDWPYNQNLLTNAPLLINSVNADRDVQLVLHVGDIHSGSQPCTSAGILPPIPTSNPGWNESVLFQFQQFNAPMVIRPVTTNGLIVIRPRSSRRAI